MKENGITDFSGVTIEEIADKYRQVVGAGKEKRDNLMKELDRQKTNATLSQQYQNTVKSFKDYLQQKKNLSSQFSGPIEKQVDTLSSIRNSLSSEGHENLKQLQSQHKQCVSAGIRNVEDSHSLEIELNKLISAIEKQEKVVSSELMKQKSVDVTTEQMQEFKDVFQHFDKDGNGTLERHELKACLQSLGDEAKDNEMDEIMARLDPNKTGKVDLATFTKFMVERNKDSDSPEMLLEAFRSLAGDKDYILEDELRKGIPADRVTYLVSNMPKYVKEGLNIVAYDYKKFVQDSYQK